MKIYRIFFAAIGLWSVAACSSAPDAASNDTNAGLSGGNIETQADALEKGANDAANAAADAMIANAAADFDASAENAGDAADADADTGQQ